MIVKGTINLIFLSCIIISFSTTISKPLHFSKEKIDIKIDEGLAIVNGTYTFINKSKNVLTRTLFYPFPVDKSFIYPDSIFVSDQNNKPIPFTKSSSGIYFSITAFTDSEATVKVTYLQRITSNEMKYILTSTQQWKQPLQKAEYKISLPIEFDLKSLSLKPDKENSNSTHNIYYITKENFMPETDLIITWARREK